MKPIQIKDLVIHQDERLLVINKPPFLSSLDERNGDAPSVLRLLKKEFGDVQLCHRLDKETSGILLVARDPETYRSIAMDFERRRIKKIYHAVVGGIHRFEDLEVELPIGTGKNGLMRIDYMNGKDSYTIFNSLKFYRHFTLVECMPVTGRTHQIRVHLASQNAPITNDVSYGGQPPLLSDIKRKFHLGKFEEEQPMIKRVALHSFSIDLELFGEQRHFEAPYPHDFEVLVKLLDKYDA